MQAMTTKKKIAITGTSLFAAAISVLPLSGSASAASKMPAGTIGDNDAVNVQTEYNCTSHSLQAEVTNKLSSDINPAITFDKQPAVGSNLPQTPIKHGETRTYNYNASGNNMVIPVSVKVDGHSEVKVNPSANCNEPVSFKVTNWSDTAVTGSLTNNNGTYPQTVTLTPVGGASQTVTLLPNESKPLVAVPFTPYPDQMGVTITVSNGPNFQSSYYVDLEQSPIPPIPLPMPKTD
jgi:hypothetical protein